MFRFTRATNKVLSQPHVTVSYLAGQHRSVPSLAFCLPHTGQHELLCKTEEHRTSWACYSAASALNALWALSEDGILPCSKYPQLSVLFCNFILIKSLRSSFSVYKGSLSMSGEVISRDFLITWKLSLILKISSFLPTLSECIPTDISFKASTRSFRHHLVTSWEEQKIVVIFTPTHPQKLL